MNTLSNTKKNNLPKETSYGLTHGFEALEQINRGVVVTLNANGEVIPAASDSVPIGYVTVANDFANGKTKVTVMTRFSAIGYGKLDGAVAPTTSGAGDGWDGTLEVPNFATAAAGDYISAVTLGPVNGDNVALIGYLPGFVKQT